MAGTDTDFSTWPLLCDVIALISERSKSPPEMAEELLLDYAHLPPGPFNWTCQQLEFGGNPFIKGACHFFWRRAEHSRIEIDRRNSTATRTGLPWIVGSGEGNSWPIYATGASEVRLRARLIRFHPDTVAAMLQHLGLAPPPPALEPVAPAPDTVTAEPVSPPAAEEAPAPEPPRIRPARK